MFNIYATDYAPVDPITPPCDIVPIFIGYKGENKARCLVFDLTECVETFGDGGFVISFIRQGDELPYLVTNTDRLDNNAIWIITDTDTAVDGYGMVQLQYIVDDVVCKSALYRTVTFDSNGITGDVPDPYEDLLAQIAAYAAQAEGAATTATAAAQAASTAVENGIVTERSQRIAADNGLQLQITELMGLAGAPSMAATAAAMTDSNKVYVYTGNEAGYINGNWYYYNGTEWVSGGVYQATAVNTDKTLTVENMAADAAVVGDRIDECMAAFVVDSTSGNIASFSDGADGVPLKDLVVNISPVQSGTGDPSPSNVRAISGATECNIVRCGKNLFGNVQYGKFIANNAVEDRDPAAHWGILYLPTPPGTYKLSITDLDGYVGSIAAYVCDENKNITSRYTVINAGGITLPYSYTFVSSASTPYFCFSGYNSVANGGVAMIGTTAKIQLEYSQTVTDFEAYNGNTYNVSFGSSAGTVYGGTLDVTTGMLTMTWASVNLGGFGYGGGNGSYFYTSISNKAYGAENIMCSIYKTVNTPAVEMPNYSIKGGGGNNSIFIMDNRYTTTAELRTALDGINAVYELAQPISVQLDPVTITSLIGNNNIWSDTGSVSSCEYRADTKLYLEKLTTPDDDMVANANITSGSYFMVGNSLYLATANIANGGAITPGTNCTATNLAAALNAINS